MLSSGSDKAKLFVDFFSENSNLNESGISLPALPSRTNLKLHYARYCCSFQDREEVHNRR